MVEVVCPTCGLKATFANGITVDDETKCSRLRGTKYASCPSSVFPTGPENWCPDLSDVAPEGWSVLAPGYRQKVLDEIARVQREKE
jgi:hypothetical protein